MERGSKEYYDLLDVYLVDQGLSKLREWAEIPDQVFIDMEEYNNEIDFID